MDSDGSEGTAQYQGRITGGDVTDVVEVDDDSREAQTFLLIGVK